MNDYHSITELPNTEVTLLQLKRSFQRYFFAKSFHKNGNLIEIGCGGGQGLNLFLNPSTNIVGYDIDEKNIEICKNTYKNDKGVNFFKEDVEKLKFKPNSVSTILIFETIYYLKDPKKFFLMLYESLEEKGNIVICSANKDWRSFNPSPFSTKYYSLNELYELGKNSGFEVETFTSFPDNPKSLIKRFLSFLKRIAVRLGLIPKTMKGKLLLKKVFSGKMSIMPNKFTEQSCEYICPLKTENLSKDTSSTAIFAVFTKK